MPIDFAAIAARFASQFEMQSRRALVVQRAIEPVLGKRAVAARTVELATKDFPIVRFYNGAVTLWLAPGLHDPLTLAQPAPSLGEHLRRGGAGFVRGVAKAAAPWQGTAQETAIARFTGAADAALAEVERSLRRFLVPTSAMFDPTRRQASDLFGLAALGFRALAQASREGGEIAQLTDQLRRTMRVFGVGPPALTFGATTAPDADAGPERSLNEQLDAAGLEILSALVVVGALPSLMGVLIDGVLLRLRIWVLTELEGIEKMFMGLRAHVIEETFVGLAGLADKGVDLAFGIHDVLAANIGFTLRFWRALGASVLTGMRDFVIGLTDYLSAVVDLLRALPGILSAVTGFDLRGLVRPKLGRLASVLPPLSLDDLVDASGTGVNTALRAVLLLALSKAREKLMFVPFTGYLDRQIDRAAWLVRELLPSGGTPVMAEAGPLRFHSDFPDLGQTIFGDGRADEAVRILGRAREGMRESLTTRLGRTGLGLDELATTFGAASARATVVDPSGRLGGVGEEAASIAGRVFGPEVEAERAARQARKEDPLARAFESWLATGGFVLIGQVIPAYVGEMARRWRAQLAQGTELTAPLTPTSPHILRRRATLGRVAVPRMTLRVPAGAEFDEDLADRIAGAFSQAVRDAYDRGETRLRELATSGAP